MDNKNDIEEYQSGFNAGYLIAEQLPDLAEKLKDIESKSDRLDGVKDGIYQFSLDKEIDKIPLPNWLQSKSVSNEKDRNKEIEKDDLDKEIEK